ncbi:hypothetical protein VNI00_019006 [Paramarasmius palmivorus]|uniref:C2H2-type domain-containing protein n=1 Tax=Paramarasmius palmivorus TaxID=297713 RepID=A0AAW0AR87_9AGAR
MSPEASEVSTPTAGHQHSNDSSPLIAPSLTTSSRSGSRNIASSSTRTFPASIVSAADGRAPPYLTYTSSGVYPLINWITRDAQLFLGDNGSWACPLQACSYTVELARVHQLRCPSRNTLLSPRSRPCGCTYHAGLLAEDHLLGHIKQLQFRLAGEEDGSETPSE